MPLTECGAEQHQYMVIIRMGNGRAGDYGMSAGTIPVREWADDRVRHMRQRVRRLKAVASILHSADTFTRPRNANRLAAICSLRMPKTPSTRGARRFRAVFARLVDIHFR